MKTQSDDINIKIKLIFFHQEPKQDSASNQQKQAKLLLRYKNPLFKIFVSVFKRFLIKSFENFLLASQDCLLLSVSGHR